MYCNRANTCLKLKRPEDCLADCERASQRDGSYAKPYALMGEAHIMMEEYEQAVRDYDRATDMDPSSQVPSCPPPHSGSCCTDDRRVISSLQVEDAGLRRRYAEQRCVAQAFDSGLRKAKLELKKSKRKDYYKILELPKDCGDTVAIKKAYRKAALKWHPDKHSGPCPSPAPASAVGSGSDARDSLIGCGACGR